MSCILALSIAAGCASTKVTERESRTRTEAISRPETIYVYPFASTHADVPSWSAAAILYAAPSEPRTADELADGRQLGALVARELIAAISEMGLAASEASSGTSPKLNDLMITGYFEAVEEGSTAKRVLIGFGSGATKMKTVVEGYQMTSLGPRLLGSGTIESGGSKTPGVIAPLVVLAATANPIGLIVSGTTKVAGEVTGKNTIENAARRTAAEIADQLQMKFKELGWVR
jgi:hypothetical protein